MRHGILMGGVAAVLAAVVAFASTPASGPAATGPSGPINATSGVERINLYAVTPGVVEVPAGAARGAGGDRDPNEPTLDIFLPPEGKGNGAAIMVCPGGSYSDLATPNEGYSVAKMFNGMGLTAFVLRYRHAPRYHYPTPIMDAQRGLRTIRMFADHYHVDPKRIGAIGFSAGGHLVASLVTMFDSTEAALKPANPDDVDKVSARPDFAVLMYPVITMTEQGVVHTGSRTSLTQGNQALYALLSPEQHVTKDTPPLFLVHGTNDRTVPVMNSVLMYEAALKAGVPAELHIFENGPHGFGLGGNDPVLKTWPEMVGRWLTREKVIR